MSNSSLGFLDRALVAGLTKSPLDKLAARSLRKAQHLLSLALAAQLAELRTSGDPLAAAAGKSEERAVLLNLWTEIAHILGARWEKLPDRRRPHYTPEQRYRILRLKALLHLSRDEAAHIFRVSAETIGNWEREATTNPDQDTVGSAVRPTPPVRRYADVVHHVVRTLGLLGLGSDARIAGLLARVGWRLSKRTVGRYRKATSFPRPSPDEPKTSGSSVPARFAHHVWMMDITQVPALFGLRTYFVAGVLDAFSRMPLAAGVFEGEPSAHDMTHLVEATFRRQGRPLHLVTDRGSQFTAQVFRETLAVLGVRHRFGAIGRSGSIALIERFWRSLKGSLNLRSWRPLLRHDLERRLEYALHNYAFFRPHQGLGGATPAEVYLDLEPAHLSAVHPPRGRPGDGPHRSPFAIDYLEPEHRFPILRKAA